MHDSPLTNSPDDMNKFSARLARRSFCTALLPVLLVLAVLPGATLAQIPALEDVINKEVDVPFVTTPQNVVDAMLALAQVRRGDTLIDLGSGDGRIVITAATRCDVPGLGVEIDPRLVEHARATALTEGVAARARFEIQDLFTTDLTPASVITLYLLPDVNELLKPRLQKLRPGTRIVSHDWGMGDWKPDRVSTVDAPGKTVGTGKTSKLLLWVVK